MTSTPRVAVACPVPSVNLIGSGGAESAEALRCPGSEHSHFGRGPSGGAPGLSWKDLAPAGKYPGSARPVPDAMPLQEWSPGRLMDGRDGIFDQNFGDGMGMVAWLNRASPRRTPGISSSRLPAIA